MTIDSEIFCFLHFLKNPFKPDERIVVLKEPPSGRKLRQHIWDTAVEGSYVEEVRGLLGINPELARSLNKDGYTHLHVACLSGNLEIVKEFIKADPELCLVKDKHGRTPLHTAAMRGRLDIMKELLDACPQSVTEVTASSETPLHVAISHDQVKAMRLLVEFLGEKKNNHDVINRKDCIGNTVLHLATSRKQLQSLKYLLVNVSHNSLLEVNAVNEGGFTAFDILDVLPQHGKKDIEIQKNLRRAGGLRSRDLAHTFQTCFNVVVIDNKPVAAAPPTLSISSRNEYLSCAALILTLVMAGPGLAYLLSIVMEKKCRIILPLMLVPFVSFLLSVMVMETIKKSPTCGVPQRPWLLTSAFSMRGAYLCLKMAYLTPTGVTLPSLDNLWVLLATVSIHLALCLKYSSMATDQNL
ncbi:hypothetical protein CRYUN_Cryun13aG0006800 [Craigia yunnanensis]